MGNNMEHDVKAKMIYGGWHRDCDKLGVGAYQAIII